MLSNSLSRRIIFIILVFYNLSYMTTRVQGEISTNDLAIVEASSNIVITCSFENLSYAYDGQDILWFFNDLELNLTDPRLNVTATDLSSTLLISEATFADSGLYSCKLVEYEEYTSTQITVGTSPDKPGNLTCFTRNTIEITCTWLNVEETNLNVIYIFEYAKYNSDSETWYLCPDLQDNLCHINTTRDDVPIKSGQFDMRVTATNALGSKEATTNFQPSKEVKTYPPSNLKAEAISSSEIQLSFNKPDDTDMLFFFFYKARYYTEWSPDQLVELSETETWSQKIKYPLCVGLESYTNYTFQVSCKVSGPTLYWSDWSEPVSGKTWEAAPDNVVTIYTTDQTAGSENLLRDVKIYWLPLAEKDKNGVILHNEIQISQLITNLTQDNTTIVTKVNPNVTEHMFSDLLIYVSYNISIKSCNSIDCSIPSFYLLSENIGIPSEPQNVIAEPLSKSSIKLSWNEPNEPNGLIEGYKVEYIQSDNLGDPIYLEIYLLEATVNDLESYTDYYFSVQAETKMGYGGFSPRELVRTHEDVPDAPPQNLEVEPSQNTLEVSWQPPLVKNQNGVIISYTVYYCLVNEQDDPDPMSSLMTTAFLEVGSRDGLPLENEVKNQEVNGSIQSTHLVGLEENQNYSIWMSASTLIGEGPTTEQVHTKLTSITTIVNQEELQALKTGLAIGITVGVVFVIIFILLLAIYHPVVLKKIDSYIYIADPKLPPLPDPLSPYVNDFEIWTEEESGTKKGYMEIFDTPLHANEAILMEGINQKTDLVNGNTFVTDVCDTFQVQQASGNVYKSSLQKGSDVAIQTQTSIPDDVFLENERAVKIDDNEKYLDLHGRAVSGPTRMPGESSSSNESYSNYQRMGDNGNLVPLVREERKKEEVGMEKDMVSEVKPFSNSDNKTELSESGQGPVIVINLSQEQTNPLNKNGDYVLKNSISPVIKELPKDYSLLSYPNPPDNNEYSPASVPPSDCSDMTGGSDSSGYVTQDYLSLHHGSHDRFHYDSSEGETSNRNSSCSSPTSNPLLGHYPASNLSLENSLGIANDEEHLSEPTFNDTNGGLFPAANSAFFPFAVFKGRSSKEIESGYLEGSKVSCADGSSENSPNISNNSCIQNNDDYISVSQLSQLSGITSDSVTV